MERRVNNDDISYSEESSGRLSDAVKQTIPEVEYAAAVAPPGLVCTKHAFRKR